LKNDYSYVLIVIVYKNCGNDTILAKAVVSEFVPMYEEEQDYINIDLTVFIEFCKNCHKIIKEWIDD